MSKILSRSLFALSILLTLLISTPVFADIDPSPTITSYSVSEIIISPNGDGIKDTTSIDIDFSEEVSAEINILDSNGNIIKNLYSSPAVTNPRNKVWDGKNELNLVVEDGVYIIQIIGTNSLEETITDTSKTITVDNIDEVAIAFDSISSTLLANGIANNLNDVTSLNVTIFSGLYFEKLIDGVKIGRITFGSALDLSNEDTINYLRSLDSKFNVDTVGTIGLNFSDATSTVSLIGMNATLKFYGLDSLGFSSTSTADEIYSRLIALDDSGNLLTKSELIPEVGTFIGACGVGETECYVFTVGVNHFTQYTLDIIAPEITINGESSVRIRRGSQYIELGAKANDNIDGEFTASSTGNVDTNTSGTYTVTYKATDSAGNTAKEVTRTVVVYSSGRRRTPIDEPVAEVLGDQTGPIEDLSTSTAETSTTTIMTVDSVNKTSTTTGEVLGVEIFKFNNNLGFGLRNNDVLELQKRLTSEGLFTASTTGYFGSSTRDAVIKYQEKYATEILSPLGLTKGTGFVGLYTRARLNKQ